MAEATQTRIQAQNVFPGDVIRWEQLGIESALCTVHRVIPEGNGTFTLTLEAQPPASWIKRFNVPADLLITRIY